MPGRWIVEQNQFRLLLAGQPQSVLAGSGGADLISLLLEVLLQRPADQVLVVHDHYLRFSHGCSFKCAAAAVPSGWFPRVASCPAASAICTGRRDGTAGSSTVKSVPLPSSLTTEILPPCCSISLWLIGKPKAGPLGLGGEERGEDLLQDLRRNPRPGVGDLDLHHVDAVVLRPATLCTVSVPPSCIACTAFRNRFRKTCWICFGST